LRTHNGMATELVSFTCDKERRPRNGAAPRVSAIIAAYNGERFIRSAVESIVNQTFRDFELIVIDDCSTDGTVQILADLKDERLRVIRNERNLGIAKSLNTGLAVAKGEYVALQDHDDVSFPTRFECQVGFLDKHVQIGMVGSSYTVIDETGAAVMNCPVECDNLKLRWTLLWSNPFCHTTIMVRRRAIQEAGGYSPNKNYRFAEDYDMMSRVAVHFPVANISQPLGQWRRHSTAASRLHADQQLVSARLISQRNICELLKWDHIDIARWRGLERFLCQPVRQQLDLTSAEVNCTLNFLPTIHETFCSKYGFVKREAAAHRLRVFWSWGKHALALSYRRNGRLNAACRFSLFAGGAKLLAKALRPA